MKAKYASPLTNTNTPAISPILSRSFCPASTDSRKINTHIAHGLKPSTSPTSTVKTGSPNRETLIDPSPHNSTVSGGASAAGPSGLFAGESSASRSASSNIGSSSGSSGGSSPGGWAAGGEEEDCSVPST